MSLRRCFLALLSGAAMLAQTRADAPTATSLSGQRLPILSHLNELVTWYRQFQEGSRWVMEPAEAFFLATGHDLAGQTVKSAFDAAAAEAPLIPDNANQQSAVGAAQGRRVADMISATQAHISTLAAQQQALADTPANANQRGVLEAQLQLARAQLTALQQVATIVNGSAEEVAIGSLAGQVQALQRTLPEIFATTTAMATPTAGAAAAAPSTAANGSASAAGLIGKAELLYNVIRARSDLNQLQQTTDGLRMEAVKLRDPIRSQLTAILQLSQQTGNEANATSDSSRLAELRTRLEDATNQYQALSRVIVPYSRELTLLSQSSENLREWRAALDREYGVLLSSLGLKIVVLGGLLIVLLVGSEVARRAAFRYVHDTRRRRQILLLRRFIVGALITLLLIVGVVSDLSSLATFAGFLTAGVALALQSVILSVAAYFFLIGRYGVKVGDRVTISGVTGEVIDIGLIRVYLMELAGTGVDLYPTGRVVVFANSALFSATTPLYKQIPGTEFTWHELQAEVTPEANATAVRDLLLAAVTSVYNEYKVGLEQQHSSVQRMIDLRLEMPRPIASVRLAETGVEAVVRYPVDLRHCADTDAKVTESVLAVMRAQPEMKTWLANSPKVRAATKA